MKKQYFLFLFLVFSFSSFSQKLIKLSSDKVSLENRKFYVIQVVDFRENRDYIGEINRGAIVKTYKIDIEGGVLNAVKTYFLNSFEKTSEDQIPVTVLIRKIKVEQHKYQNKEEGIALIALYFQKKDGTMFETEAEIYGETNDAFATHEARIKHGLFICSKKYNKQLIKEESNENKEDAIEISFETKDWDKDKKPKYSAINDNGLENIFVVGYQIGGYNIIGFDYEKRVHKYLGIHAGIGFLGFTGGIKLHANTNPSGLFLNLSWKDAGLGQLNGLGIETGSRWVFSKKRNFGLLYQGGIFILNHISPELENDLYDGNAPPVSLSLGIGLSW